MTVDEYEKKCTSRYEGLFTSEQVELNNLLYEQCTKETLDIGAIENLLKKGADPLGATDVSGWGLLDHIYFEIILYSPESNHVNLPKITELFLKYGMDVSKPKVPYDGDNSLHPMIGFSYYPNENTIVALKMLLDNGLDAESAAKFWHKAIYDEINVCKDNPDDSEWKDLFIWMFKMIMLTASYDSILDNDEGLCDLIGCSYNSYDTHKFREWDNYRYEFDTSRCKRFPELYKSVVNIYEIATGKAVWKIGICLNEDEF